MEHYFTNNDALEHHYEQLTYHFENQTMTFKTDNGVFSKSMIDYGSRVLLEAVEKNGVGDILDVGCGYGTIGLTLAKIWQEKVDLVDVNDRALDLCRYNALHNGVIDQVNIFKSFCYDEVKKNDYALIVTNPPIRAGKQVVHTILEEAYDHLKEEGELYCVIQKKQGAKSAQKKMQEVFNNCTIVKKDKGYYILKSKK